MPGLSRFLFVELSLADIMIVLQCKFQAAL